MAYVVFRMGRLVDVIRHRKPHKKSDGSCDPSFLPHPEMWKMQAVRLEVWMRPMRLYHAIGAPHRPERARVEVLGTFSRLLFSSSVFL